ncbi:MAG: hypothetical protein ACJAWV_002365 [Flammeovirgaceae bacterium]|jgi:hypothetical protein
MTLEEIKTLLNEFVKQHNLQQKALDSCEECMVNSMEEDADVWHPHRNLNNKTLAGFGI